MSSIEDSVIGAIKEALGFSGEVNGSTTAYDIDGWDSLAHTTVILMVERRLGISITEDESNEMDTVQDLIDIAKAKKSER